MTPEAFQKVCDLYHAALDVEEGQRAGFIQRACAGDDTLRQELESLIASHEQAVDFLVVPALGVVAGQLAASAAETHRGQAIGRYRVLALVGAGGMGQVYLAEDTSLGRRVALKLLPEWFSHDEGQVQRFRQEARAASALNHPNILTVHEIGKAGSAHFLATEFIDGLTLREHMARGRMPTTAVIDIAIQIASALQAAHEAGIVHRDIKPENVMLRGDGIAKVLDFGLAKLASAATGIGGSLVETVPGLVMGTVAYMSPEQARGQMVDARTDIWSLGVVLYEMLSGTVPFAGETASDVLAAILTGEPAPLVATARELPPELARITCRCLQRDREKRYSSAQEMLAELRDLRQRLEGTAVRSRRAPHRLVAFAGLALLMAGIAWLALRAWRTGETPPRSHRSASTAPQLPSTRRYTENTEAYHLYLKGLSVWNRNRRTPDELRSSRDYFQRAIDLDPSFALAYARLAACYDAEAVYGEAPPAAAAAKARAAALRAVALDDTLSEAHTALGRVRHVFERDWPAATREYRRAIELNPTYPHAHVSYAGLLTAMGRFDEAFAERKVALDLDPLNSTIRSALCWSLYFARRYDAAIAECRETLALEANFYRAHLYMALAYEQKADYVQAIAELQRALGLSPHNVEAVASMAHVHAAAGNRGEAERMLADLGQLSRRRPVDPYFVAMVHLGLGQRDEALASFDKALDYGSLELNWLGVEPRLDGIRADPRFRAFQRRANPTLASPVVASDVRP